MELLRTPAEAFDHITDFPYQENYIQIGEARMHYIDEGSGGETILALHGEPSWSYLYRKFVPTLSQAHRFIAPDLIGFGKSDKYTRIKDYSFKMHLDAINSFIDQLKLKDITLVVQDWGGLLGLGVLGARPELFKRVVILNTFLPIGKPLGPVFKAWRLFAKLHPNLPVGKIIRKGCYKESSKTPEVVAAYDAPFPSKKYKAGAKAFPSLVPMKPTDPGVPEMKQARKTLSNWDKPALVLFSDKDKIMSGVEGFFFNLIPTADVSKKIIIKDASHFLQEDSGEEIAGHIDKFILEN